jgi:microcystin degradation protein MlrC
MTMDAHANITDQLSQYAEITCGFKTVPHVDQVESQRRAANALVRALKEGKRPKMYIQRVPFLLKNDNVKTVEEPLQSLVEETKALETLEGVYSVNLFLGHCWVDAPNVSASVVVCAEDISVAEKIAKDMANKLWETRAVYKFNVEADTAEACVDLAISGKENRIFITDSGDNTTAGAEGDRTEILRLLLKKNVEKKTCVAGITNPEVVNEFSERALGEEVYLSDLGVNARVKAHGEILGWGGDVIGKSLTLSIGNVDVIFTEARSSYEFKKSFEYSNVDLLEYRIVVLKMGYLFTTMKPYADRELFALTEGSSCVELKMLNLKNIIRPMYPLDDFDFKA